MAVRIVAGRSGSGKTLRCFREIVAELRARPLAGPPIYWVVPRQATFSAERWLACGSGLTAFTRCRVVSFEGLAQEVLTHTGALGRPVISKAGRLTLLAHLLRENAAKLRHFKSSARQPGLAEELLGLLDEFGRHGAMESLNGTLSDLDPQSALHAKLSDVALLHAGYTAFLGPGRFDKDSRMAHVLQHIGAVPAFNQAAVYVDGFLDLLDFERRMLLGLCETAAQVDISFLMDPESRLLEKFDELPSEDSVFHKTERAHRALRIALRERHLPVQIVKLRDPQRYTAPALSQVETALAETPNHASPPDRANEPALAETPNSEKTRGNPRGNPVRLIEAPSARAEVDAAAREIRRFVGEGYRYREIVVLCRELSAYEHHLAASFSEHGITFFMDRRRDASCHPLLRLIRASLRIAVGGFASESVLSICKSGLLPDCPIIHAATLENLARTLNLRGDAWLADTIVGIAADDPANLLRIKITRSLQGFSTGVNLPGVSVRDAITRLLALVEIFDARKSLEKWVADARNLGDLEAAAEHVGVWSATMDYLDELAGLLGDVVASPAEFEHLLLAGLDSIDLGLTPPTVDTVIIGAAERTRPGDARAAIVLGLSEGIFPAPHQEGTLLSDRERTLLAQQIPLDPDATRRQLDETLIGYLALTRASEQLIALRPTQTLKKQELAPSVLWDALRPFAGEIERVREEGDITAASQIATPRQLTRYLLDWVRKSSEAPAVPPDDTALALYDWFRDPGVGGSVLDELRRITWRAIAPDVSHSPLPPEVTAALFPQPLHLTAERLETFAACPFRHFLRYGLRLDAPKPPEIDPGRFSLILHDILQRLEKFTESELPTAIELAITATIRSMTYDGSAEASRLAPRDRYALARVTQVIGDILHLHGKVLAHTTFTPRKSKVAFGNDAPVKPLIIPLKDGGKAYLSGSIDRIDHTENGSSAAKFLAWDYTLIARSLSFSRIFHGLSLKPMVSLLVLRETVQNQDRISGALALPLEARVDSFGNLDDWRKAPPAGSEDHTFGRRKPSGLLNLSHLSALDPSAGPGVHSPVFPVKINKTDGQRAANSRNALTPDELTALLDHAAYLLSQLTQQLLAGDIRTFPFKLGKTSACADCGYRPLCRFEPRPGASYHLIRPYKAPEVFELLLNGAALPKPTGAHP